MRVTPALPDRAGREVVLSLRWPWAGAALPLPHTHAQCATMQRCSGVQPGNDAVVCNRATMQRCATVQLCSGVQPCNDATVCNRATMQRCATVQLCSGVQPCNDAAVCNCATMQRCATVQRCSGVQPCNDAAVCNCATVAQAATHGGLAVHGARRDAAHASTGPDAGSPHKTVAAGWAPEIHRSRTCTLCART